MSASLVVVGGGGFGREAIDVIRAANSVADSEVWNLVGVVDDALSDRHRSRLQALGVPFLGAVNILQDWKDKIGAVVGVGSPQARRNIAAQLEEWQIASPSLVHPSADIGSEFAASDGMVVCAGVSIGTNVEVGKHVHINAHSVVGHDVVLQDFVSLNPNSTVSGECVIGTCALVGAGAIILQGIGVGESAVVGAGAVCTRDVDEGRTVKGSPAT